MDNVLKFQSVIKLSLLTSINLTVDLIIINYLFKILKIYKLI